VRPESYRNDNFRVRYMYPGVPDRGANQLDTMQPANWIALVLYRRDPRYAALFEVGFDGPPSKRTFVLLDGANLEKKDPQSVVKDILNGGASTWPEIAGPVERISAVPLINIPRASVTHTNAVCEFPTDGMTFAAVSVSGNQSNWKFRDGVLEGIPLKTHSGPFNNSDLKRVPSPQVYMNTYGP
jgi:hypothetical protein